MGITDSTSKMSDSMNRSIKSGLSSTLVFTVKLISALFLSYTLSLVGSQIIGYGNISVLFIVILGSIGILRLMKDWTIAKILVFDLIFVLLGLCFKLYIMIAP